VRRGSPVQSCNPPMGLAAATSCPSSRFPPATCVTALAPHRQRDAIAHGPGNSTASAPSAASRKPRAAVSWRSPVPEYGDRRMGT
jgi:hypothetical protein